MLDITLGFWPMLLKFPLFSGILEVLAGENGSFVLDSQQLPALQRDGHISVLPKEIVESAKIEFVSVLPMSVGKEFVDLQFTDLV
jgi:hypothetical protein